MADTAGATGATKYHLSAHGAEALLGPVEATLRELTARVAHYRERLRLAAADDAALAEAHAALVAAHETVERVYTTSIHNLSEGTR